MARVGYQGKEEFVIVQLHCIVGHRLLGTAVHCEPDWPLKGWFDLMSLRFAQQ